MNPDPSANSREDDDDIPAAASGDQPLDDHAAPTEDANATGVAPPDDAAEVDTAPQGEPSPPNDASGDDGAETPASVEAATAGESSSEDAAAEEASDELAEEPEADEPAGDALEAEAAEESSSSSDDEDDDEIKPLIEYDDEEEETEAAEAHWYILKVQSNREDSIRDNIWRRLKRYKLDHFVIDIVVPTEDVAEFNKSGKRRIVKRKLFQGYIMMHMIINDDTWFAVRETPGVGDFTGAGGKPTPMDPAEVQRYIKPDKGEEEEEAPVKTAIPFKAGDRVRVKEGYFQNFEGDVELVDETHGRVTVMINIFGRPTPVELEHWQMESV